MKEQLRSLFMIRSPSDEIRAPVTGRSVALQDIPDEVFSQSILGHGIGFLPETGDLLAPVWGKVLRVLSDGQVIWLEGKQGVTLLLQIGLNPDKGHNLQVEMLVKKGDPIKSGDPLAHFELGQLSGLGEKGLVVMVATSLPGKKRIESVAPEYVIGGRDMVFKLSG